MMPKALALPKRCGKTLISDLTVRDRRPWWGSSPRAELPEGLPVLATVEA
jgi:hypothetical protein